MVPSEHIKIILLRIFLNITSSAVAADYNKQYGSLKSCLVQRRAITIYLADKNSSLSFERVISPFCLNILSAKSLLVLIYKTFSVSWMALSQNVRGKLFFLIIEMKHNERACFRKDTLYHSPISLLRSKILLCGSFVPSFMHDNFPSLFLSFIIHILLLFH